MATELTQALRSEDIYSLFNSFGRYSLNYVYKGIFNPGLTDQILSLAESNMNMGKESSKTQKKVYFVMVESLQNITRHQDVTLEEQNQAFFVVQHKEQEYDLSSGNVIQRSQVDDLKMKLDKINSLGADELKEYYKYVLEKTGMSEKGGAGLGLIEMARRSGNKLAYDFEPLSDALSYFYFRSRISAEPAGDRQSAMVLDEVKQLHAFTRENNVHMIYHGIFTHENLKSLLSMTEGSVGKADKVGFRRKSVNVMIELLQNICNHGAQPNKGEEGKPGMLLVCNRPEGCVLVSANYVEKAKADALRQKLELVNASNENQLDDLYSEIIMKDSEPGQKGAGLGLIDMRMKTGGKLNYSLVDVDGDYSFLSVNVTIPY